MNLSVCMRYSRGQGWAEWPPAAVSEGGRRQVPVVEKHWTDGLEQARPAGHAWRLSPVGDVKHKNNLTMINAVSFSCKKEGNIKLSPQCAT
jgi:hypothetical protein